MNKEKDENKQRRVKDMRAWGRLKGERKAKGEDRKFCG